MNDEKDLIRRKVDMNVFTWCLTILSGVMLSIASFLFSEIAGLRTHLAETVGRSDALVKELAAKLEAEKEKNTSILVTLAEIKGDVKGFAGQLDRRPTR
jgi:hypothetical protein